MRTAPYQPSLLRLLHGGTALLAAAAWLSGLVLLLSLDRRWGSLPFPVPGDWVDLHGLAGLALLPVAGLFVGYACTAGRRRLWRGFSLVPLLALLLALGSGRMMEEDWLREGQLDHLVYRLHLSAWVLLALSLVLHTIAQWRRGGWPLIGSMTRLEWHPQDSPSAWWGQIVRGITGR